MSQTISDGPQSGEGARESSWSALGSPRELALLVYRQMRVFAGPHRELEDLAQTALEQVLLAKYEPQLKLSSFTYVICYRVWLKHLRWTYRFRKRFSPAPSDEDTVEDPAAADPETSLEDREKLARLYLALEQVSPKRRAVVTLYYLSGLEVPEIAQIVETQEATVRSRLRDGRNTLRKVLARDPYFAHAFDEEATVGRGLSTESPALENV